VDLSLDTPELSAFRQEVRNWFERHTPADWQDRLAEATPERRHDLMGEWARVLREGGYLAPHWPTEFGGGGLEVDRMIVLKQEMVRAKYPPVGSGIGLHHAAATIIQHGTPEQQKHLGAILDGEVWCQGFSEPNAGSDLASLQTRALRDGDRYIVNGQKIWSSGAQIAAWCLLLARTDPSVPKHKGLTLFMVEMASPGIEVRPIRQATGASEFCEIFFTDVSVPVDHRLGPENEGWRLAGTTLTTERGTFIVENHARLLEVVEQLVAEAARTPVAGGHTALDDGAIRSELAERTAEVEVLGMLAEQVIAGLLSHGEMGPEGSTLKLFYSETLQKLTWLAARIRGIAASLEPQSHHASGWTTGEWLIDHIGSWTWTIAAGSNEIQRNIIGERVLGLPREPRS
jgi:alkylation response protein AidB-like acyl-CoA dehydrogenase